MIFQKRLWQVRACRYRLLQVPRICASLRHISAGGKSLQREVDVNVERDPDVHHRPSLQGLEPCCWSILSESTPSIHAALGLTKLPVKATTAGAIALMVLLVSKSHVHLLNDGSDFCSRLISQSFHCQEGQRIDLLAAVVDGVTYPSRVQTYEHSGLQGVAKHEGFEGISVWISDSEQVTSDRWSVAEETGSPSSNKAQQTCTLSFQFDQYDDEQEHPSVLRPHTTKIVQLPVANTLFQNGLKSTLYVQQWIVTDRLALKPQPMPAGRSPLPYQVLHMPDMSKLDKGKTPCRIATRLEQITPPRVVAASLGNIIRRLHGEERSEDSVPASTELEVCVPKWLQSRQQAMEQVQVWALVIPQGMWHNQSLSEPVDLQREIESGSRLHKVLSGGGGWGIKKGLLALDPDLEYREAPEPMLRSIHVADDPEAQEERQELGGIIRPGDVVAFYAYDRPTPSESHSAGSTKRRSWHIRSPASIALGTVPSTVDCMPGTAARIDLTAVDYIFAENHFGMVSEQGMALTIYPAGHDVRSLPGVKAVGGTVQTKLDAPYTHVLFGSTSPFTISEMPNAAGRQSWQSESIEDS